MGGELVTVGDPRSDGVPYAIVVELPEHAALRQAAPAHRDRRCRRDGG